MLPGGEPAYRAWEPAWARRFRLRLTALALLGASACGGLSHIARDPSSTPRIFSTEETLHGRPFELHFAVPPRPVAPDVLVLYASGDGGWFGAALDMFRAVGDAGFYAVGLSTRTLLQRETPGRQPLTVNEVAADYEAILARATEVLHLAPDRRVVLTGWSRGASLAVLVGGARYAPPHLAGVVAIGLGADENLGMAGDTDDEPDEAAAVRKPKDQATLDLYPLIGDIAPRRCAVIQATGDRYLHAAQARALFGPDSDLRRFYEVAASNHRFGGGAPAFIDSLRASLRWVVDGAGALPVP